MHSKFSIILFFILILCISVLSYQNSGLKLYHKKSILNHLISNSQKLKNTRLDATLSLPFDEGFNTESYEARNCQPLDPGPFSLKIKGKIINIWGFLYAVAIFGSSIFFLPFFCIDNLIGRITGDMRLKRADWFVHTWARLITVVLFTPVHLYGTENLPPVDETVLYVPNHTSFMDIIILSSFIPRPFKYLSKAEILNIPIIGIAMRACRHVFLYRDRVESAFEVSNQSIDRLKGGSSMVLFPEGTRSRDGKLKEMKKGAFQIAKKAGVRIVPISIGNVHRWMPADTAMLPYRPMRDIYVKIHPPVDVTPDSKVSVLRKQVYTTVNEGLPKFQQGVKAEDLRK